MFGSKLGLITKLKELIEDILATNKCWFC